MTEAHTDGPNYCPCGKQWPCRCPQAWRVMGFVKPPTAGDDSNVVATAECGKCGEDVLLEIDPEAVDGATKREGRWVVEEAGGPAIGFCCGLLYCMQPDGRVESFVAPKRD